jgi:hypothetical protein
MGDHIIIRYFPQVTWDIPLAAAGNTRRGGDEWSAPATTRATN